MGQAAQHALLVCAVVFFHCGGCLKGYCCVMESQLQIEAGFLAWPVPWASGHLYVTGGCGLWGSRSTMKSEALERGHATEAGHKALVQRNQAQQDTWQWAL